MKLKWEDDGTFKSPLSRARGLGSAGGAVTHWWHQRLTSVANLLLMLWLVCAAAQMPGWSYDVVAGWLAQPINAVLMLLSVISVFYHAALGCQVIAEDYIHHEGLKIFKLGGIRLFFLATGVTCVFSILKIAFTG
ncbi:MAG: succinate dehydrogenase, hydrophobic membrane anchor protein [Rhodospirillales bacterium]|nr:succinate dehydrogenase, hydrophobic membrane anchor protein [Rhodospirillales bacterium]MCB9996722.1 succinate dehydrogenase, hydrophobic membrane anchor protein [Rhodospirillales bacterium]